VSDTAMRNEFIRLGFERSKVFSWDRTAGQIYSVLERVAGK